MQTVSVTEFKAHCLEFVNQVAKTGQPLILTKRGKPTAMVSAPPEPAEDKFVLGQFRDQVTFMGDVVSPFDEPWIWNTNSDSPRHAYLDMAQCGTGKPAAGYA